METLQKDIETLTLEEIMVLVKTVRFHQRRFKRFPKNIDIKETLDIYQTELDDLIARFFDRQTKLF